MLITRELLTISTLTFTSKKETLLFVLGNVRYKFRPIHRSYYQYQVHFVKKNYFAFRPNTL